MHTIASTGRGGDVVEFYQILALVLWYLPVYKIVIISISYDHMSTSQNIRKSIKQCARPLRSPWTSPM